MRIGNSLKRCSTRREFVKQITAASGAIAAPLIIPGSALGKGGEPSPANRITMGAIGIGGRGTGDLRAFIGQPDVHMVAVCDVQKRNRDKGAEIVNSRYGNTDCATYRDLRELLARPDIDAVVIATGDRWHALASIMAMRAGKDVYCEKPGALTVAEGRALVDTQQRYGRVFQTGAQRASEANFVCAGELLRSGRLGEVHTVYAHLGYLPVYPRGNDALPAQPEPSKEDLDWDLWLGTAPWRDYNPAYLRTYPAPGWYAQYDFATGVAMWGSHTILQCQLDLGLGDTSAVDYEYNPELIDAHFAPDQPKSPWRRGTDVKEFMTVRFANGVKLVGTLTGWRGPCGVRYEGSEGWVSTADGYSRPDVSSPALLQDYDKLTRDYSIRHQRSLSHARNFLDCVKSRRTPVTPAGVAHRTMTTNLIMDMCLDLKRSLKWDPAKEAFIGDEEANRLRKRAARKSWTV